MRKSKQKSLIIHQ